MMIKQIDRTTELEIRLKAIKVGSEDTCCFWEKRDDAIIEMRRCFFCKFYRTQEGKDYEGYCMKGVDALNKN